MCKPRVRVIICEIYEQYIWFKDRDQSLKNMNCKQWVGWWQQQNYGRKPSLLSRARTWLGECKDAITLCDQLQNFFWRVILKVSESCPKVALKSDTGMLRMKWRLWQEKIFILMRIRNHSEDTICRQIYEEGELREWPGLGQEVKEICKTLDIRDNNKEFIPKHVVKNAVVHHH